MVLEGARVWFIPDTYLATPPNRSDPYFSHEAVCILNTGPRPAHISLDFYFEDRPPVKDVRLVVEAERTAHVRLDKPKALDGFAVPPDTPYAIRLRSDQPVIVQYSRLDTTQPNLALMTTMAYPLEGV